MAVFSSLRVLGAGINGATNFTRLLTKTQTPQNALVQLRQMSGGHHKEMVITPSRFQWHKFKDLFHYYVLVGLIPLSAIIFYANVFVGPAQLAEIPEGYEPKHWEYHRSPITRFLARYWHENPQQGYEKYCHLVWEEEEKRKMRLLEKDVMNKMKELNDYEAYYYKPVTAKYHRYTRKVAEEQARDTWAD